MPHILLPKIISGSYLCLYTYIFSWPHSNRAICIILLESLRFTIFGYKQRLKQIFSGLYEASIRSVDSYSVVKTVDPRCRLITLFVLVEFTKKHFLFRISKIGHRNWQHLEWPFSRSNCKFYVDFDTNCKLIKFRLFLSGDEKNLLNSAVGVTWGKLSDLWFKWELIFKRLWSLQYIYKIRFSWVHYFFVIF